MISPEIAKASLHISTPWYTHLYGLPFVSLYPLLAYAYYVKYDQWLVSEEWTFLACVSLGAGHALSFLITKWNAGARAWITTKKVSWNFKLITTKFDNGHTPCRHIRYKKQIASASRPTNTAD